MRRVGGFAIADRRAGAGPPVVFVHGLAVSSRYFVPALCALSAGYRCRAVNLPGFGLSDKPPHPLGVAGLADALAAWLRSTGLMDAALVGNSAGCQYVVDCVARHRDITGPLVLIGPTTDPAARTATGQIGRWLRTARYADAAQLPVIVRDVADGGAWRVAAMFRAVLDDAIETKLSSVRQRVLVLRGSRDPLVPRPWAQEVVRLLPRARLVEIARGAHVVHATRPAEVASEIDHFLQSTTGVPA